MIARLSTQQADFQEKLSKLLAWESVSNTDVAQTVDDIIANIRQKW
jgi:histidinol dehydrogenase (EC 1.1.1.23)